MTGKQSLFDVRRPRDGVMVNPGHYAECWYASEGQETDWIVYDGLDHRDKIGRRQGRGWWHRFVCNDPSCPAVLLVRSDVLNDVLKGLSSG